MTLKQQLLVVGTLTLLIPLAGIQFVIQLEQALKAQELNRMADQALRVVDRLPTADENDRAAARTLFAETFDRHLILDGYGDDWPNRPDQDGVPLLYHDGAHLRWRAALRQDYLWLFLKTEGLAPPAASAGQAPGDRVLLHWQVPDGDLQKRVINAHGPGRVRVPGPAESDAGSAAIEGAWQIRTDGISIELKMPRLPPGSLLGFSLLHPGANSDVAIGGLGLRSRPLADGEQALPMLIQDRPELQKVLASYAGPGQNLTLITPTGWQLAQALGSEPVDASDVDRFGPAELLQRLTLRGLRLLLAARQEAGEELKPIGALWQGAPLQRARGKTGPATALTVDDKGEAMLTVIAPVMGRREVTNPAQPQMYLISRVSTEALLSLSSATLGQVLSRSLLVMSALLLLLAGYATWLSWRISRLRQSVNQAVDHEGRVTALMKPSNAADELGDLSRQFARLVAQVRSYTGYLESFASKLSHELKTPLAITRSSLDNLQHCAPSSEQAVYLARASAGTERLSRILTAMSEASRLEKSLTRTAPERFDLSPVLQAAAESYQALDPRITYKGPAQPCLILGAADLLIQAADKLVENARDFTPPDGHIQISLSHGPAEHLLSICNDGPALPESMVEHIFDSFVTLREPGSDTGHLGQGLVIVKLVADFHQARVSARNRDGGVCISLRIPALKAGNS